MSEIEVDIKCLKPGELDQYVRKGDLGRSGKRKRMGR